MKKFPHLIIPRIIFPMIFALITFYTIFVSYACSQDFQALENKNVRILFEPSLDRAAKELAEVYPEVRAALETTFGWRLNPRPTVLLIGDGKRFYHLGLNPLIVAFAVPKSHTIVMNYTKMSRRPFALENTLKHEMCHLLLHQHIPEDRLPKWLDEGVCQWASDGIGDIMMDQKRSLLHRAVVRGTFIPLDALKSGFPANNDDLLLAYEESKSFVAHIISRYHKDGILRLLSQLKKSETLERASLKALAITLDDLEQEWHDALRQKATWFTLLSTYLYEILFGFMALVSIFAFIKIMLKKRAYMADDPQDPLL